MASERKHHLLGALAALAGVVVVIAAGGWLYLRSSLPQTDGTVVVGGLSAPVSITRDAHGIPCIGDEAAGQA